MYVKNEGLLSSSYVELFDSLSNIVLKRAPTVTERLLCVEIELVRFAVEEHFGWMLNRSSDAAGVRMSV